MKNWIQIGVLSMITLLWGGCNDLYEEAQREESYDGATYIVSVQLNYPAGYEAQMKAGVKVKLEDINRGTLYTARTDAQGVARFETAYGLYRISARDQLAQQESMIYFNGSADQLRFTATTPEAQRQVKLNLLASKSSQLVIKEIYCGGCLKYPLEGQYQSDKYLIIYNNSSSVAYLDQLCFGTIDPYNSAGSNPWLISDPQTGEMTFRDYLPIVECVWGFPGKGTDYPLEPGKQVVLCICGAIDHTIQYPLSVNLNHADYFVCYDNSYYTNTTYHPTPGDQIRADHYLQVLRKMGSASAYTFSLSSPVAVLFRVPAASGSAKEYVNDAANEVLKPGALNTRCVKVPNDWVQDGVEVFSGSSTGNSKRVAASIDAGYVMLTSSYLARTLYRNVDKDATEEIAGNPIVYGDKEDPSGIDAEATLRAGGRVIYLDSNNSTEDFHERGVQSLHSAQ
ncbi:MAG: DUF4876 domain-containing protein [Alistipes sp.]|nr:DUF4876 domain-containing protein [Alistipes sp.]